VSATAQTIVRSPRRICTVIVTALAALTMLGSIGAASANAMTASTSGTPGGASFNPATAWFDGFNEMAPGNFAVTRSPATAGDQYVRVTFRTWGYNTLLKQWVYDTSSVSGTWISRGSNKSTVTFNWFNPHYYSTSVDAIITWQTPSGTLLGKHHLDYNATADYHCVSGCHVYTNPTVGAYVAYNS
jgi:hypothetical protein